MHEQKFVSAEFSNDEIKQILNRSHNLIMRGYFTGINFLQSDSTLPDNFIVLHFLHNSKEHLKEIQSQLNVEHLVVPRSTIYPIRREYTTKKTFRDEYLSAIFYDSNMNVISIDDVIANPEGVIVSADELDLLVPINSSTNLIELVDIIKEADDRGPYPWKDPVLIIRTKSSISQIPRFSEGYYFCINRRREEFYAVLTEQSRAEALERYIEKLCAEFQIGTLKRSDIVFNPCKINEEFKRYVLFIQGQFDSLV